MTAAALRRPPTRARHHERASVLVTALLLAFAIGFGIVGYLQVAHHTLLSSERTFYQKNSSALAEAGLEEALYCFHQLDAGQTVAVAWTGWTIAGVNASRELPAFNCDQNAVGIVRVYVAGCDGATVAPLVTAQARIAPFDGSAPLLKTLQIKLHKNNAIVEGLVARNGLSWTGHPSADSFISNPSGNPAGPWVAYPGAGARANTEVIVPAGSISLGSQGLISGTLALGTGVTAPPASQVTGQITTGFTGAFPLPAYPTAGGVSHSYSLGATVPATLPRGTDLPAADGRYYYFFSGATIANTTITTGKSVTFVGTTTSFTTNVVLGVGANCLAYIDGAVNAGSSVTNPNWAGALQIYTSTTASCSIGGNAAIYACVYAPNAALSCNGGGSSGMLVGSFVANTISASGHMDFHYDESLHAGGIPGPWTPTSWFDLQSSADRSTVAGLTGGYLR